MTAVVSRRSVLATAALASVATALSPSTKAAAVTPPPTTRVRLLTANFRLTPEPAAEIAAGHAWSKRKAPTLALLKEWAPTVICAQECSTTIRHDLAVGLGMRWRYVRNGSVSVWYNTDRHTLVSSKSTMLPSPASDPRRLVLAQLKSKASGHTYWVASTHFTPPTHLTTAADAVVWREKQMTAAAAYIKARCDIANIIFGGDFNSDLVGTEGPRALARAAGLLPLRDKIAGPLIRNGTSNSFNGWQSPVPHSGLWLDDVFTGSQWMPYYARVIDTGAASDHQWIIASSVHLAP